MGGNKKSLEEKLNVFLNKFYYFWRRSFLVTNSYYPLLLLLLTGRIQRPSVFYVANPVFLNKNN